MSLKQNLISIGLVLGVSHSAIAEEVHIAVAANFTAAMKKISADFEQASGHKPLVSYGSTGKLYTQIVHNAPFEVFLSADQKRPQLLHEQNKGEKPMTYAMGKLVLWSRKADVVVDESVLKAGDFKRLALANPKIAPYGAAALEVMTHLQIAEDLRRQWILGDSIAQTYQFVATGNAAFGFVALAQIALDDSGSRWMIPQAYYTPIRQDAMLLKRGADNPAAVAFLAYLHSDAARQVITRWGYMVEEKEG